MAKIDMSEVKLLKEDLTKNADKATSAIAETKAGLGNIKDMDSFKGDGAKATKNYITHAHNNLIEVYDNIIEDLKSNFTYSMDQFSSSVDNDASCIIDSSYVTQLKTEVTSATKSISSAIKSINKEISSISDITSASKIQTTEFKSDEKEFKKIITDMIDKFEAFISASSNKVSQSKEFISTLNSMQGQIQKISAVPNGIKGFNKSKIQIFKDLRNSYKNIKKYAKPGIGAVHFVYHAKKGNIKVKYVKYGKLDIRIVNPKAIIGKIRKNRFDKWTYTKDWGKGTAYRAMTGIKKGKVELANATSKTSKFWTLDKSVLGVSKGTIAKRLKDSVKSPFTGWKNLGTFGKFAKGAGLVGTAVDAGLSGYDNFNDATKQGLTGSKRVVSTTVNTSIDVGIKAGGAAVGAKAGAIAGAWAGSFIPIVGTGVGAAVGAIVGGAVGSGLASKVTKKVKDGIKKGINKVIKNWAFG
ncbi:T7SS effector LXG polymorphic toxin [Enterococcus crotali]|uniref:T7SS effector LXG polymorphic toxin n=1 Tax=Enterococcus crotali TaxID=1453587 RepID=UPI000471935B|nr:T7SS effector LXG polymorphic toxin [Enterococcus crotali]